MSRKSSAKSVAGTAWKIIVGILLTLLVLVIVAEMGLRWFLSNQMTSQFEAQGGGKPEVSFGSAPLVFGLARGEFSELNMSTPSTLQFSDSGVTGQPASKVHMEGLRLGEEPIARRLTTTATLPDDYLLYTLQQGIAQQSGYDALGNIVITGLTANQAEDVIDVEFAGGLFSLSLDPEARDGALAFTATSSKLLAWELPQEATNAISNSLSQGLQEQMAGSSLRMDDVKVLDGDIELTMSGDNVNLNEMNQQFGDAAGGVTDAGQPQGDTQAA